jgi:hypothetical protein
VVIFELAAGFTLYFRRTRVPTMIVGTLFHLSNTFVLLVPGFLNCVAMYALFFEYPRGRAAAPSPQERGAEVPQMVPAVALTPDWRPAAQGAAPRGRETG